MSDERERVYCVVFSGIIGVVVFLFAFFLLSSATAMCGYTVYRARKTHMVLGPLILISNGIVIKINV